MAKKDNTHPQLLEIKALAKKLQSDAKQSGINMVYGHALDRASAHFGYKDWNTACGLIHGSKNQYFIGEEGVVPLSEKDIDLYASCGAMEKAFKAVRVGGDVAVGTQSLEDFGMSPKKIFYVKNNPLMSEHQNIINSPSSEAIPEEHCGTLESIDAYVREKGGSLFYPTNSIADFQNLSNEQKEVVESNIGTKILLGRTGQVASYDLSTNHDGPFVIGRPGVGQSFYIEDIEDDMRFIKANFDDDSYEGMISSIPMAGLEALLKSIPNDEIVRLVNMSIPIHNAISRGHGAYQNEMIEKITMLREEATKRGLEYTVTNRDDSGLYDKLLYKMATETRKYGSIKGVSRDRAFIKGLNDENRKKRFRK